NFALPDSDFDHAIFAHWDDLLTYIGDRGIYTSVTGSAPNRVLNIEWRALIYATRCCANFEVQLYEGQNRFDIVYGDTDLNGSSATIGVQNTANSQYTQYSWN